MTLHTLQLDHATDWPGFRRAARGLLMQGISPDQVLWQVASDQGPADLFAGTPEPADTRPTGSDTAGWPVSRAPSDSASESASSLRFPKPMIELCQEALLHEDPLRLGLIYRLLWRLQREPTLRHDPLDADVQRLQLMARAVRRDMHKMKAFVRFRQVERQGQPTLHVAWFEPGHHIVEAIAPFFMRRFTAMHWTILTPRRCVHWDGRTLVFTDGARRDDAPPADAGEALWLVYYANIFNPARLKLAMMRREMPTKYWHNLPEASLIDELAAGAVERSGRMLEAEPTLTRRRLPHAGQDRPAP